jgi:hypothetical protein
VLLDDDPNLLLPCRGLMLWPDVAATVEQIPDSLNINTLVLEQSDEKRLKLLKCKGQNIEPHLRIFPVVPNTDSERFGGVRVDTICDEKAVHRLACPRPVICKQLGNVTANRLAFGGFLPRIVCERHFYNQNVVLKFKN